MYDDFIRRQSAIEDIPAGQPEPAIPLSWIEAKIDWLIRLGTDFSVLTAAQVQTFVNMWKDEQKEGDAE